MPQMFTRPKPVAKAALSKTNEAPAKKVMNWPAFTNRFGLVVRQAGVTAVPRVLLTGLAKLKIKPIHAVILLQLIACWGNSGPHPFPSRGRLRQWIGCDKRTLDRAIAHLVKLGLVQKKRRHRRSRRQTTNEYDLGGLVDRLKPLARIAINERKRREQLQQAAEAS
jgi:hypothetical protein